MSFIPVGSINELRFTFVIDNTYVDPITLVGEIFTADVNGVFSDGAADDTFIPTKLLTGLYAYQFTPATEGKFKVVLTGTFDDPYPDIVHSKILLIGEVAPTKTLKESITITMLGQLCPLYVDPEDILAFYPAGDKVEITELIYRKSVDLEKRLGQTHLSCLTELQYDYIIASVMCELSRMYGLTDGGLTGFDSADSFQLGDLSVERGGRSSRLASGKYDEGNANSWCELAAYLQSQLGTVGGTFRPVVAGSAYCGQYVPSRRLKSADSSTYLNSRWD